MYIKRIIVGNNYTNCYLVGKKDGPGVVIDPGGDGEKIYKAIKEAGIRVEKIINTHGHFDHIGANDFIQKETAASVLIHRKEKDLLTNSDRNLSILLGEENRIITAGADELLEDGDEIIIGTSIFKVLHTPGHSPGGICLYNQDENILFSGDTIFSRGIGRADFPGCSEIDLYNSIESKILPLPDETIVYPGHGGKTTIGDFKSLFEKYYTL